MTLCQKTWAACSKVKPIIKAEVEGPEEQGLQGDQGGDWEPELSRVKGRVLLEKDWDSRDPCFEKAWTRKETQQARCLETPVKCPAQYLALSSFCYNFCFVLKIS